MWEFQIRRSQISKQYEHDYEDDYDYDYNKDACIAFFNFGAGLLRFGMRGPRIHVGTLG